jgi:cobalt/nickel transport system permease protein
MHIPDGFLSTPALVTLGALSIPAIGYAARAAQEQTSESKAPLLGVLGAFVFAAQMINFPVAAGTSSHLLGGTLLAATVGPAAAVIVMTAVLAIQAFVFQDGGILALGANIFNLAIAGVLSGYLPYRLFGRGTSRTLALLAGGALSVVVSSTLALSELAISGVNLPPSVLKLAVLLFSISALAEGLITVSVVRGIEKINPQWIRESPGAQPASKVLAVAAGALMIVGVFFASALPDGLESIAGNVGLQGMSLLSTPLADYELSWLGSGWIAKTAAGVIGLSIVFAICRMAGSYMLRRRSL